MTEPPKQRDVESCIHRETSDDGSTGVCQLLGQVSGVSDRSLLEVERAACEACCESFLPTPDDWNPVTSSLLHGLAMNVQQRGGVEGCSSDKAERLANAAIETLPVALADEDDIVDDVQQYKVPNPVSADALRELLPPPAATRSEPIRWAIGVTTAPRRQPTLTPCLQSLIASGWTNPHLFIDGDVHPDSDFSSLPRTHRPEPIGAWPAWCESLRTLMEDYPNANTLAVIQDDALFPAIATFRDYVEQALWPESGNSIVSLYTAADDTLQTNQWRRYPGVWKYGAVAFVIPRHIAESMLKSIDAGELNIVPGTAGIDTRIGVWADRMKVSIWHPSPSLVQHIGQVSSIWKNSRAVGLRRASRFLNDEL